MNSMRKWDITNEVTKKDCIEKIIILLDEVKDRDAGVIFAAELLDTVTGCIGPEIYNMALVDVKKVISDKIQDLDVDIDLLHQS